LKKLERSVAERKKAVDSRAAAVVGVWNSAVASNRREQLDASRLKLADCRGYDGRSIPANVALRRVFKDTNSCGSTHRLTAFGLGIRDADGLVLIAAQTVLREQSEAVRRVVKLGDDLAVLHWQFDGTPQRIRFQDSATAALLAVSNKVPL
jgi:hypothetical protein